MQTYLKLQNVTSSEVKFVQIWHSIDCDSNLRGTPTGEGGHLHLGLMLGQVHVEKWDQLLAHREVSKQSGTTQGPVHQLAYGGPSTIKTERTASALPACLPACHPRACWVTLTRGSNEGSHTLFRGKERGNMVNEALLCKWNRFWITTHTQIVFCITSIYRRDNSLLEEPLQSPGMRRFIGIVVEVNKSYSVRAETASIQKGKKICNELFTSEAKIGILQQIWQHSPHWLSLLLCDYEVSKINFPVFPYLVSAPLFLKIKYLYHLN